MRLRLCVAALLLLYLPGSASAQEEPIIESAGYSIGETSVLHPTVIAETGFVSNVFYQETNPVSAGVLRVFGQLDIASRPPERIETADAIPGEPAPNPGAPPKVEYALGAKLGWEQYLSGSERVTDQSNFIADAHARVIAFPQGKVRFLLEERFMRFTNPTNFESRLSLPRDVNHLMLGLDFRPGGGALGFGLRYVNYIDVFESNQSDFADRIQHDIKLNATWQWLPITQFFFEGSLGIYGPLGDSMLGGTVYKQSSLPLRLQFGVATAFTERTSLRGSIGFGKGFYDAGADFTNAIGGLEFGFRYSPFGRFTLAYEHDFRDSINANFYRDHALIAKVDQQIWRILLDAKAQVRFRRYEGIPMSIGPPTRDDVIFAARLRARYLLRDWLALSALVNAVVDETDYRYTAGTTLDDPSFSRVEAIAGVTAGF